MGETLSVVDEAVGALGAGGVVVIPTDTVYGLAARLDRPRAIERIFEIKGRPPGQALQVLVGGAVWLERLGRPSEAARRLAGRYWPGPLTIIVAAAGDVPAEIASGTTIGLRAPGHPVCIEILDRTGPLAASSANRSGEPTPSDLVAIRTLLGEDVDVYVDGGELTGLASTVVDLTDETPRIVREGAIATGDIERALEFGFEAG